MRELRVIHLVICCVLLGVYLLSKPSKETVNINCSFQLQIEVNK